MRTIVLALYGVPLIGLVLVTVVFIADNFR